MPFPWYDTIDGDQLQQGDILWACPVVLASDLEPDLMEQLDKGSQPDLQAQVVFANVIVMTQSCDLSAKKVNDVALCEILPVAGSALRASDVKNIRVGRVNKYHLINKSDNGNVPLSIVDFTSIYSMPLDVVKKHAISLGERPRLLPPYREHLAQAFARFFMRVGLPNDISDDVINESLSEN